jgi:hypothetical protein
MRTRYCTNPPRAPGFGARFKALLGGLDLGLGLRYCTGWGRTLRARYCTGPPRARRFRSGFKALLGRPDLGLGLKPS